MKIIQTNLKYREPLIPLNLDKVFFIIVHHPDAITATPEEIHQWHLDNGWNGFGYNEYIRKDGTVYIGRGDNIGAQCANMNSKSYGICCEGNYDTETKMTNEQFNSLIERIKFHKKRFKNLTEIAPHSKFYPTSCPGKNFPIIKILDTINNSNNNDTTKSIQILYQNNIISTPEYWIQNAIPGKNVTGEYAGILIKNMANKLI